MQFFVNFNNKITYNFINYKDLGIQILEIELYNNLNLINC